MKREFGERRKDLVMYNFIFYFGVGDSGNFSTSSSTWKYIIYLDAWIPSCMKKKSKLETNFGLWRYILFCWFTLYFF